MVISNKNAIRGFMGILKDVRGNLKDFRGY